jgi:hypothetical protein
LEQFLPADRATGSATNLSDAKEGRRMSIQHNTPRSRESSTLSQAWFDGNRQAIEANKFFSLATEPDAIVKVTPDLKKHKWMHRQVITH